MKNDFIAIWSALNVLEDYFSRLGGSARYFNMSESEIPLYIGCFLIQRIDLAFEIDSFVATQFVSAAEPILKEVHLHLNTVNSTDKEYIELIKEFINYSGSKLKPQDKSGRWIDFSKWFEQNYI